MSKFMIKGCLNSVSTIYISPSAISFGMITRWSMILPKIVVMDPAKIIPTLISTRKPREKDTVEGFACELSELLAACWSA